MDASNSLNLLSSNLISEYQLTSKTFNLTKESLSPIFSICRESMKDFFDVILTCGENELKAHRMVLAASSSFFKKRLSNTLSAKEDDQNNFFYSVNLDILDWNSVLVMVDCMYSSQITITNENVYSVIKTSKHFDMPEITNLCVDFLETYLQSENCIEIMDFADSHFMDSLKMTAQNYLVDNFKYVYQSDDFKSLEMFKLVELIRIVKSSSTKICESEILNSIITWVYSDPKRKVNFTSLFDFVELSKLKLSYLTTIVAKEPLILSSLPCMRILLDVIQSCVERKNWTKGLSDNDFIQIAWSLTEQRELFSQCFHEGVSAWYVISSSWLDCWVKFVTNDGYDWSTQMELPDPPGPIDNSSLFTNESCNMLKRNLQPKTDYKFIPDRAWHLLCDYYGIMEGQKPISEKGPVFGWKERFENGVCNDRLLIDPVLLNIQSFNRTKLIYSGYFSRWDRIERIEEELRNVFEIREASTVTLYLEQFPFKPLDSSKLIADYHTNADDILFLKAQESEIGIDIFSEESKTGTTKTRTKGFLNQEDRNTIGLLPKEKPSISIHKAVKNTAQQNKNAYFSSGKNEEALPLKEFNLAVLFEKIKAKKEKLKLQLTEKEKETKPAKMFPGFILGRTPRPQLIAKKRK